MAFGPGLAAESMIFELAKSIELANQSAHRSFHAARAG
jgi:hypothetical protein